MPSTRKKKIRLPHLRMFAKNVGGSFLLLFSLPPLFSRYAALRPVPNFTFLSSIFFIFMFQTTKKHKSYLNRTWTDESCKPCQPYTTPPQFGEFFARQSGETVKVDKVANLFWGCQSGETVKTVKVAKVDRYINLGEGSKSKGRLII